MKKLGVIVCLILSILLLVSCSENTPPKTNNKKEDNRIFGTWVVVKGSDKHTLVIDNEKTLKLVDGDTTIVEYTFEGNVLTLMTTDEIGCFTFELVDETLVRYESGEKDGYIYRKKNEKTFKDNPLLGKWSSIQDFGYYIEGRYSFDERCDFKDVQYNIMREWCFKDNNTFTCKTIDINEYDLIRIFKENTEDIADDILQAEIEKIKDKFNAEFEGTYEIRDGKIVLNYTFDSEEIEEIFELENIDDTTMRWNIENFTFEFNWKDNV